MVKLVCSKCNYRFEAEKISSCPYCGENTVDREKSANELINEVTKMLED